MPEKKSKGRRKAPPQEAKGASADAPPEKTESSPDAGEVAARKKRSLRAQRIRTTAVLLAVFFALSALILALRIFIFPPQGEDAASGRHSAIAEGDVQADEPQDAAPATKEKDGAAGEAFELSAVSVPKGTGTLCFVFDDAGHNLFQLEPFLELPFPCAVAVLPSLAHSAEAAERIRSAGKEAILHQPMQAANLDIDPGPGAVLPGMTAEEIRAAVNANLDELWPLSGLNNHEGSLVTADAELMEAVFDVVEERGIFFLDSRTIAESAAPKLAVERGMRILERAVFLDNSQERDDIVAAVLRGASIASQKGHAVMIGHVWSDPLAEILRGLYPELVAAGHQVSDLSGLLASLEEEDARLSSEATGDEEANSE